MKYSFILILFCLFNLNLEAGILKGTVKRSDQEPIAYATIGVPGTEYATIANENGEYFLKIPNGKYTFKCEAMSYQSEKQTIEITDGETTLDFTLRDEAWELGGTTISAKFEDRAIGIMKKVIASRAKYAKKMETLETDVYLKGTISINELPTSILGQKIDEESMEEIGVNSDRKGMIYALEQVTKYWYKRPDKTYHYVESVRESGNNNGLGFAQMPPIINIYENNITILNGLSRRGFISPASDNAFFYYQFKYMGSYNDGDYEVHKIKVTPKRKFEPLFTGYLYVVEGLWLFQAVELSVDKNSQIDILDTLILEQYFRPRKDDVWVINSQTITPKLSLMGVKGSGTFLTSYMNLKINEPIADSIFKKKEITSYDSLANDRDTSYWNTTRPIPLEKEENKTYVYQDSLSKNIPTSTEKATVKSRFSLLGSNVYNHIFYMDSTLTKKFSITHPLYSTGFNTVEGLYTHLNFNYNRNKTYSRDDRRMKQDFTASLNNRFSFKEFSYDPLLSLNWRKYNKKWSNSIYTQYNVNVGRVIRQYDGNNPISPLINTIYSLLGGYNYAKILRQEQVEFNYKQVFPLGFSLEGSIGYYRRNELFNQTDYTWAKEHHYTSNLPSNWNSWDKEDAFIVSVNAAYNFGQRYISYPKYRSIVQTKFTTIGFNYSKGVSGIGNSVSNFDKWNIYAEDQLSLGLLGKLNINASVGGFLNAKHVHYADYNHFNGNQTIISRAYNKTFQLASYYQYSNVADVYGRLHLEWLMAGWLSNKIPLFRRLNWHFLAGTNAFYVDKNQYYAEAFFGVDNIGVKMFRLLRVDAILGYESNIAKPTFGIRLGIKINSLGIGGSN